LFSNTAVATKGAGATEAATATTATEEVVAEAAAAQQQQRCHGGGGSGRHGGRGDGDNSSGGGDRGSGGGNKGSGDGAGATEGVAATAVDSSLRSVEYLCFFSNKFISYVILRRPHTDRITEGVPKKFRRNRNCDSCEKSATEAENAGILRIPAGITNLAFRRCPISHWFFVSVAILTCTAAHTHKSSKMILHHCPALPSKSSALRWPIGTACVRSTPTVVWC